MHTMLLSRISAVVLFTTYSVKSLNFLMSNLDFVAFFFFFFPAFRVTSAIEVKLELQLPATATAMQDLSQVIDLHHSSQQRWILNSLSEVRDQTLILMDPGQVH